VVTGAVTGVDIPPTGIVGPSSLLRISVVIEVAMDSASFLGTVTIVLTSIEAVRSLRRTAACVTDPITTLDTCVDKACATPVM
jgi:hypothetical protein